MARALIVHTFADGSKTHCEIQIKASYPDAMSEAVARVRDLWRETCAADDEAEVETDG